MVPTSDPGFSYTPIHTIGEASTYATYYTDIRVPAENIVGEPGEGCRVITTQLNHERVALCSSGSLERPSPSRGMGPADQTGRRAPGHRPRVGADPPGPDPGQALRAAAVQLEGAAAAEELDAADASATKVWGTELYCEAYGLMLEVLGAAGALKRGSPGACCPAGSNAPIAGS